MEKAIEWYIKAFGGESNGYNIWTSIKPAKDSGMHYAKKRKAWWIHCTDAEKMYKEHLAKEDMNQPPKTAAIPKPKKRRVSRRHSARKAAETRKRNLYYTKVQVSEAEHFAKQHGIAFRDGDDISLNGAFVLTQLYGFNRGTASLEGNGIPEAVEAAFRTTKPEHLYETAGDLNTLVLYPFETITTNNDSCVLYDENGKAWTKEMYEAA